MTYCEKIGLNIGDEIEVMQEGRVFLVGERIRLVEDDDTAIPFFENSSGRRMAFALEESHIYGSEGKAWKRIGAGTQPEQPTHDPINKPSHYMLFPEQGIEFIDVRDVLIERLKDFGPKQIDYWSRAFEYLARAGGKNGVEDIKKAKWYLDRLVKTLEEKE